MSESPQTYTETEMGDPALFALFFLRARAESHRLRREGKNPISQGTYVVDFAVRFEQQFKVPLPTQQGQQIFRLHYRRGFDELQAKGLVRGGGPDEQLGVWLPAEVDFERITPGSVTLKEG